MTGWLADWLTGLWQLTDWLAAALANWLTDWLTHWLTDQLTGWLTGLLIDWVTFLLNAGLLNDRLTYELSVWPTYWWLTDLLTDWPTDWLTDRLGWQRDWPTIMTDLLIIQGYLSSQCILSIVCVFVFMYIVSSFVGENIAHSKQP